eukprot:g16664.t1
MASKKCGAAIGLAGAAASTAFIAGTGSSKSSSLRGVKTHQAAPSAPSAPSASTASYAAASVLAASVGAVMARRPVSSFSQTTVTALKAFEQDPARTPALGGLKEELGVQPPVGYWDPAGLARDGDVEAFQRRRSVELKHGRIAMLATMGYITPEIAGKFPGYLSPSAGLKFADVPNGLAAISKVPAGGWTQILLYMGWCEVLRLSAELANGRLAMMAIIGMFYQDGLTGSAWGDWSNFTDSPLRAFENETGVQPPVGFWDPLGLSVSGSLDAVRNQSDYKRRREVELKHGRVAMFATIGYILPEYWRFPGYLSKFLDSRRDIKFADVPNGLAAFSKVPALGWLQIVGFAGIVELNVYNEEVNNEPGNYGAGFLGLRSVGFMNSGITDPEIRKKKLNAELANGRLAMMAIIGMFFQDGLTGSAWGDWANYTDSPLRAFESELGVQPPVGFWDPLGLSADGDLEVFQRRREFTDIPNGLAALTKVPGQGWAQIVAFLGTYELFINKPVGDEPGNYGKGNLGLGFFGPVTNPEARKKKLSAELANGRLAMMAIIGMFFQDGLTGSAWGDWALYTDSPLRSGKMSPGYNTLPEFNKPKTGFEGLIGDQAPLGFWDPLGLAKDKDVEVFKRRRETEIKHGRVAMFATMGYIVPEYYKFDGYLSPSMDLKFADVPNGLKALSVVPKEGWAQMLAFAGFLENRQLSAELANGRLAMMAIIGMFFQDGLTGSAWGDWAAYTDSPLR